MDHLLRLFTPPEWREWNLWGKLAYLIVFAAIMAPVMWIAPKVADAIFGP